MVKHIHGIIDERGVIFRLVYVKHEDALEKAHELITKVYNDNFQRGILTLGSNGGVIKIDRGELIPPEYVFWREIIVLEVVE